MSLRLGGAPADYDRADQAKLRADLTAEDRRNHKRGEDLELAGGRLIMTDTVTGTRHVVSLISGVLTVGSAL